MRIEQNMRGGSTYWVWTAEELTQAIEKATGGDVVKVFSLSGVEDKQQSAVGE